MDRQTLLFDADDTLWEMNSLFERVIEDYFTWLDHPTLDPVALRAVLDDVERASIVTHGYGSAGFLRSLHACFEQLSQRAATAAERDTITSLAARLIDHDVELMPGVADTLSALGDRHDLRLLTKGQAAEQQRKIDASGLAPLFRSTHIVAEKEAGTYRTLLDGEGLDPASTWMIGNSPRSDVVAAREAGLRAVFIPHVHTWSLEHTDIDPADAGVLHLRAFPDLLEHF